ncbi:uncharacterized protein LOC129807498 [Phlebotomus papatasi]|uniref:uncharacterized protein LOC129807498 n=1 Tax=Phlebotomus papatasi TaxID=29031 RepID=UPI002484088A|nr:uncharacterized protein LOC129807498 [Phlebotomus papatasi]
MENKSKLMNRSNSVINALKLWPLTKQEKTTTTFGSSVAVQKLRESKWFDEDEQRIFCAVVECGFIVEVKGGQENDGWFGVVICKTTKDKKPKPESIEIFTIKITERRMKILKMTLPDIWRQGAKLRINNFGDKDKPAHSDKDIRNQVIFAQKAKQMLWHNSKHFAYWCRYGDRQQDVRRRQVRIFLLTHILKLPN